MTSFRFLIFTIGFIFVLNSCNSSSNNETNQNVSSTNICKNSRWLKIYDDGKKVTIKITNPDDPKQVFVFEGSATGNNKSTNSIQSIKFPSDKLAVMSSTHIGMLTELNALNSISAISDVKLIDNQVVKRGVKNGKIISLGDEGQVSIDKLLKSKTKVMVYSAFSGDFSQQKKFDKLGIICFPNYDWRETTPLGKADWLLLFGYLTGKQEEAKERVERLNKLYFQAMISAEKKKSKEVYLLGNQMGDFWYAPAGESYQAILLKDAGINYLYANTKGTGSLALPMEQIIRDSKKATVWLNPGFASKKEILVSNPKAKFLNVFQHGRIYCYSSRMNYFWENSTIQPHWFLHDLQEIKAKTATNDNLYFYNLVE